MYIYMYIFIGNANSVLLIFWKNKGFYYHMYYYYYYYYNYYNYYYYYYYYYY